LINFFSQFKRVGTGEKVETSEKNSKNIAAEWGGWFDTPPAKPHVFKKKRSAAGESTDHRPQ